MSKLKDIEREHLETAEKLIIAEQLEPEPPLPVSAPVTPASATTGIEGFVVALPAAGSALLTIMLAGGQVPPNSELLIETINGMALDTIADHLIDYAEGVPYIYDDYIDDLKSSLGGQ